jgi:hypothetical protein
MSKHMLLSADEISGEGYRCLSVNKGEDQEPTKIQGRLRSSSVTCHNCHFLTASTKLVCTTPTSRNVLRRLAGPHPILRGFLAISL